MSFLRLIGITRPKVTEDTLSIHNYSINLYWPLELLAIGYTCDEELNEGAKVTTSFMHIKLMFLFITAEIQVTHIILTSKESALDDRI